MFIKCPKIGRENNLTLHTVVYAEHVFMFTAKATPFQVLERISPKQLPCLALKTLASIFTR